MANNRRIRKSKRSRKSRKQSGAGFSMDVVAAPIGGLTVVRPYSENNRPSLNQLNEQPVTAEPSQSGGARKRSYDKKGKKGKKGDKKNTRKSRKVVRKTRKSRKTVRKTRRNRKTSRK